MKINLNNLHSYKTNLNFGTLHYANGVKNDLTSPIGKYNHTTSFFRNNIEHQIVYNYIKNLPDGPKNIVSAGCSFGEEVYTYSMLSDDIDNVYITGVDCCCECIDGAKDAQYVIDPEELSKFVLGDKSTSEFDKFCEDKFKKHFEPNLHLGEKYNIKTNRSYKLKKGHLTNCDFQLGNIQNIDLMFDKNSVDVMLCCYVLYHTGFETGSVSGVERLKTTLARMKKVLKPNGIIVFSCDDVSDKLKQILTEMGFRKYQKDNDNIWQKPKD